MDARKYMKEIPDTWSKWGNVVTMTDEQIDEFIQEHKKLSYANLIESLE